MKRGLRSWLRKIIFSLVVVVAFCLVIELAARAFGPHTAPPPMKPSKSPILFQQIPQPLIEVEPNESRIHLMLYVDSRSFLHYPKSKNTFRVFAFGGSATMGMGFPHNGSFSRWLERMLQAAYPDREMEVVNMGQIGFASEQVKVLVQEVLDKGEPDLLVVYSGHNEYLDVKARLELEKAGVKLPAVAPGDWLERHSAAARFLRGLRPARNAKKKVSDNLLGDYLGNHLSEQQIQAGQARYEKNLVEIARAAKARRTPLIFCTLLANPLPTAFDSYFFDERWSESEKHQVSQAIGWARLQRWDKAEEAVQGMIASAPQLKLLRIFEADGVRGLDALSPAARRYLADAAPAVIRAITGSSLIRSRDYYVLAVAYRVAGDRAGLAATLQRLDEDLRLRTGGDTKRVIRLLRAQFDDAATFHRVFRELWASDTALITARPITNETIRAVAAREGVALADVEQKLSDWLDSAPDHYLLDYCHLNIEGAFAVAQLIFDTARKNRMLPPPERNVDFRATMLAPELTYLRTTGHDFLERDKYLGLNFRVCFVYAPPFPNYVELSRWLEEDARNEHDRRVVDALVQNFHYYQGH